MSVFHQLLQVQVHDTAADRLRHRRQTLPELAELARMEESLAGRLFVSNADLHSHGVAAPDLGIGAIRNATILNAVAGREIFRLPKSTAFTSFTLPA